MTTTETLVAPANHVMSDWSPPPGWPAMSLKQIETVLCAPGQPFEIETIDIDGIPTRCWKNAPPSLAALAHAARAHGERTFVVYEDERVSYEGWFRAMATLAQALQAAGIGKGDRVALAMRNLPEWPVAFFAIVSLGAIAVPLNAWWTGGELAYGIADSGAKLLIADAERVDRIMPHLADLDLLETMFVSRSVGDLPSRAVRLEDLIGSPNGYGNLESIPLNDAGIAPDDAATIFYTSGTTGNPKGALGSHRNMTTNILTTAYAGTRASLRRGETPPAPEPAVMLTVIPLFHVTACSAGMTGIMLGGSTMVFMHKWDTQKAFQIIERERVTATGGVPTIAWQLIEHPDREKYDLSSLKSISYGGAPSAPELVRKIREVFGALPGNGWGMTETMATVTSHTAEDYLNRPDSCGPAVPVSDLRIVDADGVTEMPIGEVGELWARGPQIVKGYWNKPAETAATFVDGWVRTGDLARLDEERFC